MNEPIVYPAKSCYDALKAEHYDHRPERRHKPEMALLEPALRLCDLEEFDEFGLAEVVAEGEGEEEIDEGERRDDRDDDGRPEFRADRREEPERVPDHARNA